MGSTPDHERRKLGRSLAAAARAGALPSEDDEALLAAGVALPDVPQQLTPRQQLGLLRAVVRQELARTDLLTDEQMAQRLRVSLKVWRRMCEDEELVRLGVPVGTGRERQHLRWNFDEVLRHLRGRT